MMFPWQKFASDPLVNQNIALRITQGEVFTWQQLEQKISSVAQQLIAQGVDANCEHCEKSVVALCGKNDFTLLLMYLACIQLGIKVMPLNPALPQEKIQQYCQEANVKFYYSSTALELPELVQLKKEQVASKVPAKVRWLSADFQRPATLTLTSGSTGNAKAVVHHLQAHLDNAKGVCQLVNFKAQHSWLLSLPLYHVSGQGIVWRWLTVGATLFLAEQDFYVAATQATHLSLVPTQLQRLLAYWQANQKTQIHTQHILLGGSHIPPKLTEKLTALGIQSYVGYGMTEMASTIFAKKSDGKCGVGQPLLGREYCLVNNEVWLRGAGLAIGYWRHQQLHSLLNAQGWLASKDKAEWRDGELRLLGRFDNQFISGGENIQPEEIEALLLQHKSVKQVFVLPKKDPEFGQRPVAIIEFFLPFSEELVAELRDWLQTKIEKFKQPVAYFPLCSKTLQQGHIKISRQRLQQEFKNILGS